MLDPQHAGIDARMAALWHELLEWQVRLRSATSPDHRRIIRGEIKRLKGEILLRQDQPWPEDLERSRQRTDEVEE
jgi:hypothetical protein